MIEVIVSKRAQKDVSGIKIFTIEQWGEIKSSMTGRELKRAFHFLSEFPDCGQRVERKNVFARVVPRLPFVILYRRNPSTVTILRVIHNKQKR